MASNTEHMFTNIALWFSSKPNGTFILHSPVPRETRAIKISSFNYSGAREKLVSYLSSLGTIHNIQYNHKDESYQILIGQKDSDNQIYTVCYIPDGIIEI